MEWFIHLIMSNVNWMITASFFWFSNIWSAMLYFYKCPDTDALAIKVVFVGEIGIMCLVYTWLAYFTDSFKKINFINQQILK
jgi:hypothetical protein